jgi:hypothetical protein
MQLVVSALTFMAFAAHPLPGTLGTSTEARPIGLQLAQASHRAEQICLDAVRSSGYRVENILSTNTFSGGSEVIMRVRERDAAYVVGCDYSDNTSRIELYQLDDNGYRRGDDRYTVQYQDHRQGCNSSRYGDCYNDRYYEDQYILNRYDNRYDNRYNNQPYDNQYGSDRYEYNRYEYNRYEYDQYDDATNDWQGRNSDSFSVRSEAEAESVARRMVGDQLGIRDPDSEVVRIDDIRRESNAQDWIVEGSANGAPFVIKIRSRDASILDFDLY